MSIAPIQLTKEGHVALIQLTNPPANTWTKESLLMLQDTLVRLQQDPSIYALVITGEGDKFFSAGADLKQFQGISPEQAQQLADVFLTSFTALRQFSGVTIAAINGFAMGGGLECALSCDIRIAERQSKLGLPEAKVGLLPCGGGTQILPWLVGEGWAKRMILCGETLSADQAFNIGLLEEVVDQGKVLESAMALARQVGKQSPMSVKACKQLIQGARVSTINGYFQSECQAFTQLFSTSDQQEGVNAFLAKRDPVWKNQ